MASISSYFVILGLKLAGIKKIFLKDPINYKKLRKSDVKKAPKKFFKYFNLTVHQILKTSITKISSKQNTSSKKLLIFIPGGAFVSGPAKHHWSSLYTILKKTNVTCWMIDYPKAPEVDIVEISKNIDAVYNKALEVFLPENIILLGDSVGGNLCLGLTQRLIKQKLHIPKQLILITPVFDSSMTNKEIDSIDKKDPMLSKNGVLSAKKLCAKELDLKSELISPLYGNFTGFPKTTLFIGGRDIMFPDSKLAIKKICSKNTNFEVIENNDMPHIWPLLPIMKEAKTGIQKIIQTIKNSCLLLFISAFLLNCQPKLVENNTKEDYNYLKRKWMLVQLKNFSKDTLVKYQANIDLTSKDNDGKAYAGCNQIQFGYKTNTNNKINLNNIVSTYMYCENVSELESSFIESLGSTTTYNLKGHFLTLITKSNDSIKFVAVDWD